MTESRGRNTTMNANPLSWQIGSVEEVQPETPSVKTFTLSLPAWIPHRPGQHYDLRLTAPDGYQAQRSYSIASAPEQRGLVDLTIERVEDGEVSAYMHDVLIPGDAIEVRGPIGGYFVWDASLPGPLILIAGGSGIVPLMAMLRHRHLDGATNPTILLYSSRSFEDIIYQKELAVLGAPGSGLTVHHTLTRRQPPGWSGFSRRIDRDMLKKTVLPLGDSARVYVCGPTRLVEVVADDLVALGFNSALIKTERFGPTGV